MFSRKAVVDIETWYRNVHRKPLVIRGARQVGKTTAVQMAARNLQVPLYSVNLERNASLEAQFARCDISTLLLSFSAICGASISSRSPGILLLDEAQATPSAYGCLRYFYEDAPNLAVILTGSLLDQVLKNHGGSAPVGRVEYQFMGPVAFDEFLAVTGHAHLAQTLAAITLDSLGSLPDEVHGRMLEQVRRYVMVGGMPHAVQIAIDTDFDHHAINKYQTELIQTYKADFAKYRGTIDGLKLNSFFNGLLAQVGSQFSHKLAHQIVEGSGGDNRLLNSAIEQLGEARLFYRVLHSNAEHVPLGAETKIRISKFLFVDVGALLAAQNIPIQSILGAPLEFTHQGVIAEQFVGQHLLYSGASYREPELYYWHPPKHEVQAEVDFLLQQNTSVIPIEVKSAPTGRLKSLHSYVLKRNAPVAARIYSGKAGWELAQARLMERSQAFRLLNLPFYMITALPRLSAELRERSVNRAD
jgi:uncharacterized protein